MAEMSPVEAVFFAALELKDPNQRAAYLEEACGTDADLRRRVGCLLEAHPAVGSFLEGPPSGATTTPFTGSASLAGTVIAGRYKLLEEIGEGGMGHVWMAEQREPVKRLVALKLIKPGMDSRAVLTRFEAERQALALMDHPNIAKVFDGGTTSPGQPGDASGGHPYFVMELVKGLPLTEYCDQRRLSVTDRLHLFGQICSAVQHAHQKGVIHRDLKPSNILVTEHDGLPVPKVIDFGLAKALGNASALTDKTLHTAFGTVVGTPLYMAPEQVGINALDVDTRTDIYALGVVLYELLTGTTPLERRRVKEAAWEEVKRLIREEEPPKPSLRLSASDALPSLAANRRTEPTKLSRFVRGDLDWIVLKTLDKDRNRRYATAHDLAQDIQRFLAEEPVSAGPPTSAYRLRKFVRKNRTAVIATVAIVLSTLVAVAGQTWNLIQAKQATRLAEEAQAIAEHARQQEAQARQRAEENAQKAFRAEAEAKQQAETAQALTDFLRGDLLRQADISMQPGGLGTDTGPRDPDITVRTLLDRAAAALDKKFISQPLTEAAIRATIAETYIALGQYNAAQPHLERYIALYLEHRGKNDPSTLLGRHNLAALFLHMGKYAAAEKLLREVITGQSALLGPNHHDTLRSMYNLTAAYYEQGRYAEAEKLLREVITARATVLGNDHLDTLTAKCSLAILLIEQRQQDQAERLLHEVITARTAKLGADHPITLSAQANLATLLSGQKRYKEAEAQFREVLRLKTAKMGATHPSTLSCQHNLAQLYNSQGKPDKAEALYREVIQALVGSLGADHPETLSTKNSLAVFYQNQGKLDRAELLYCEVVAAARQALGLRHPRTIEYLRNLAYCQDKLGRTVQAETSFRELVAVQKKLGATSARYAQDLTALGGVLLHQRQWTDAETILRESLTLRQQMQPDAWTTFNTQSLLGGALWGQKKYAEAEPLLLRAYEGLHQRVDAIPPGSRGGLAQALNRLVLLYEAIGKPEEASRWRQELTKSKGGQAP